MLINYIVDKKIIFYQNIYFKKIFNCFKINKYKLAFILINPKITNFLLFYNDNNDKKTSK